MDSHFTLRKEGIKSTLESKGTEIFFKNSKNIFDNLISIGYYIEESLIACVSAFFWWLGHSFIFE